jgi:hypothetical protein
MNEKIKCFGKEKKWASYLHRTATTDYPCCLPTLGDLPGAGRIRLARDKDKEGNQDWLKYFISEVSINTHYFFRNTDPLFQ